MLTKPASPCRAHRCMLPPALCISVGLWGTRREPKPGSETLRMAEAWVVQGALVHNVKAAHCLYSRVHLSVQVSEMRSYLLSV